MVKLRGFRFKSADLDNATAITIGFFAQDRNKHCGCAATQRFAKPLFSMCSIGFLIDFRFFAALLQGFIVHIFNDELIAVCKQFIGKNVVLHFTDVSQLAVQITQSRTQAIIPFAVFPFALLLLPMLPLQPFDCAIRIIILRICSAARTFHCAKRNSNFIHETFCLRSCRRSKYAKVANILAAKGDGLCADIYCVCVLSNNGERLMPTFRLGKVRRLLKDGKAKIVKHHPFTIQLLYDSKTNKQPIEICEDVGYNYIGISVKSESHEYVSAQYDTLQDEKEHHDDCRKMRRARRNRLRYRKPRFDNRKRSEGWLAPSLKHKKELNVNVVKMYCAVMPITHATVEVGSFDTMLVKAIQEGKAIPEGADYQKGPRYNLATLREAVFYRDNYVCKVCGRKATEGAILHMHHMFYWKGRHGNSLNELLTVCEKCHTPANHQKSGKLYGFGEDVKFADLSGAAFMNTVRWQIVNELYAAFGKPFVTITYGAMTKEKRIALQLEKSHNNDAYAMGEFHPNHRCAFEHYEKVRRNNRILEKFYDSQYIDIRTGEIVTGKELFNGRINRNHKKDSENLHKYRGKRTYAGHRALLRKKVNLNPGDLVSLNGEPLVVLGTHTRKNGAVNVEFETPSKSGRKSASLKKLKIVKAADSIHPAWEKVSQIIQRKE